MDEQQTCKHNWRHQAKGAGLLALRVLMGLAMAHHGYQKVFEGQRLMLAEGLVKMNMPMPGLLSWLAALAELVGGVCIALGLGTRVASFFVLVTMGVAFSGAHGHSFEQGGELAYLYVAVALALILTGAGKFSLDALICCKGCCKKSPGQTPA